MAISKGKKENSSGDNSGRHKNFEIVCGFISRSHHIKINDKEISFLGPHIIKMDENKKWVVYGPDGKKIDLARSQIDEIYRKAIHREKVLMNLLHARIMSEHIRMVKHRK